MSTSRDSLFASREEELREQCARRVAGLGRIVKRLRASGDPDDFADGAFLLGAMNDISEYVDLLRQGVAVVEAAQVFVGMGIAIQDEGFVPRFLALAEVTPR